MSTADEFEFIEEPARLLQLEPEWRDLCARSTGHYLGQTFDWARLAWEKIAQPRGRGLLCLVVRRDGRLAGLWPLVTYQQGWKGTVVRPLDSETSEYAMMLVEDGDDQEQRVAGAWQALLARPDCDMVELENVRCDTVLGRVLAASPTRGNYPHLTSVQEAPWVSWKGIESWDAYNKTREGNKRRELVRQARRLAETGELRFERYTDPAQCERMLDWMLQHKSGWVEKGGLPNNCEWLWTPPMREFLVEGLGIFGPKGQRVVAALTVGGKPVAAQLLTVDGTRVEGFIAAYDLEYSRFSPGQLLQERSLQWACENGLDYDFRIGLQSSKSHWMNELAEVTNYTVANSARGAAWVAAAQARRAIASRIPQEYKERIKTALGRPSNQPA